MNNTGKIQALLATLTIALPFLILPIICSANAQTISKPSVPEFTIRYVDNSYDIPPTYGIDQYTGENVTIKHGEHIDNRTVEITIKNQPFTPFNDSSGHTINRFFDVRYKGSYGNDSDWTTLCAGQTVTVGFGYPVPYGIYGFPIQDYTAPYTTIVYQVPTYRGKMDFQVHALDGYTTSEGDSHISFAFVQYSFHGEASAWSNTQTISIPDGKVTTSLNTDLTPTETQTPDLTATPTPSVPEFSTIAILPLFAVLILAALLVKSKLRLLDRF